ncbi:uncharacterized protein LOC121740432 [Aricia agestis]|uniref:uncharacterized protein LOC121740432 n=1 Tax=Aricia agestis TaxID=91739 RepID=UPI001C2058B5|nr:uncharacterized protein LOC121740432 [Aricia agestis]
MADARLCVFLFIIFFNYQIILGKPFLGLMWCDLLCDDDDDVSTVSSTTPDDDDLCSGCPTRRPPSAGAVPPIFNMRLPPTNGMNLSMANSNGQWSFNLDGLSNGMPPGGQASTAAPMPNVAPSFGIWNGTGNNASIIPVFPAGSFPNFSGK